MIPRFKLIAAALSLVVAAGTIGDASARVIDRTIVKKTIVTRSFVAPRAHRVVVVPRLVVPRPVFPRVVAYRAPVLAYRAPVLVRTHVFGPRIVRAPVVVTHRVAVRRTLINKTIIR